MELNTQNTLPPEAATEFTSAERIHTFLVIPKDAWGNLHKLIKEKKSEALNDVSLFELLRPMPDIYLTDVENDEYKNKPDRDVGDVAVVVVDGILHDTKRNIWISKNWGCDLPSSIEYFQPGHEPSLDKIFPDSSEQFISKTKFELDSSYKRLGCNNSDIGFIHIISNAVPTTFFEFLSDTLTSKFEFVAIDTVELRVGQSNFYNIVSRGTVSDWGINFRRKPFTLENYSLSSISIKILLLALVIYLLYSYTFGA